MPYCEALLAGRYNARSHAEPAGVRFQAQNRAELAWLAKNCQNGYEVSPHRMTARIFDVLSRQ
jgi:hypothetical protein